MISRRFLRHVDENAPWSALAAQLPNHPDALRLFKMLALQRWLRLPDAALIDEIGDRLSLRQFCGFAATEPLPPLQDLDEFRGALGADLPRAFAERWSGAPLISVVSPVYRAEEIVDELVRQLSQALQAITPHFEIVLVEDGSGDASWARIAAACAADRRVRGIKLSRNFGQHYAITAGLEQARGAHVVVMDCDLQDDPSFIAALYAKAAEGFDVVLTEQRERAHGLFKRTVSRLFARSLAWMSGGSAANWLVGGFSLLSRRAVESFLRIGDVHRHYLALVRWLGFSVAVVPVEHRPRYRGKSSYDLRRLIRHGIDGWVSQSNRLLYLSVALGFTFLFAALAGAAAVIVLYFVRGFAAGWPSIIILILIGIGAILLSLGILGLYVGRIFDQVRGRPLYVVDRTLNAPADSDEP